MTEMNRETLARGWRAGPDDTVPLHIQINFTKTYGSAWVQKDVSIAILLEDALHPVNIDEWSPEFAKLREWLSGHDCSGAYTPATHVHKKDGPVRFRWVCGRLFGAATELDFFVDKFLSCHPEVVAKWIEIKMSARIRESGMNLAPEVTSQRRKKTIL